MNAEQTAAPLPALSAAAETPLSHYEKKGAQAKGQRPERAPGFCAAGALADNQRLLAGCDSGIVIQEESPKTGKHRLVPSEITELLDETMEPDFRRRAF